MSQFVNYSNRSVALPPGCKDLIDLLSPTGRPKAHSCIGPNDEIAHIHGESVAGKLAEIERYVARVFHASGEMVVLLISTPDDQVTMNLGRDRGGTIGGHVVFGCGDDRERAMRVFYRRHELKAPSAAAIPEHFSPHLPVQCLYPIDPLPSEPTRIAGLATALFRDVCGLDDEAEIRFRYYEVPFPK